MSVIAGIDYDSNAISVVMLDVDTNEAHWHERRFDIGPRDESAFDRARRIRDVMPARAHWCDSGVILIAIEHVYSRAWNAGVALSRVQGAILACTPRELAVLPLPAHEWKYKTVGKAKATKEMVAEWVAEQWSNRPADATQDADDAYAIAWAARKLCEKAAAA